MSPVKFGAQPCQTGSLSRIGRVTGGISAQPCHRWIRRQFLSVVSGFGAQPCHELGGVDSQTGIGHSRVTGGIWGTAVSLVDSQTV